MSKFNWRYCAWTVLLLGLISTFALAGGINNGGSGSGSGSVSVTAGTADIVITPSPGTGTFTIGSSSVENAQTSATTYTVLTTDASKCVTFNGSSPVAVTIPSTATTGFGVGFGTCIINYGSSTVTITPTTSTINGVSSIALGPASSGISTSAYIFTTANGSNYVAFTGGGSGGGGGTITSSTSGQVPVFTGATTIAGNTSMTYTTGVLTLGLANTTAGSLVLKGGTSGGVTVNVPAAAGTTTFTLPGSNGSSGQFLQTDGSGVTSWQTASAASGVSLGTSASVTNPQISGDATTGLYTAGAAKVDVSISGTKVVEWASGAETVTGTETITSASATSLAVGPNGATTPSFTVDSSTASIVNGVTIAGKGTGGTGPTINATGSDTNIGLTLTAKGSGNAQLATGSSGNSRLLVNSVAILTASGTGVAIAPSANAGASTLRFNFTPAADTTLNAGVNAIIGSFSGAGVVRQHSTGSLALQTDYNFGSPTYSFVGASTVTDMGTLTWTSPGCGTNATCTNVSGLYHPSTALTVTGAVTNSYAINVAADTGATNNYAARFAGPVVATATITTGGYTVATLPTGVVGMMAYVTDQTTACAAAGAALTGGGSVTCPVFYNGSAWVGG